MVQLALIDDKKKLGRILVQLFDDQLKHDFYFKELQDSLKTDQTMKRLTDVKSTRQLTQIGIAIDVFIKFAIAKNKSPESAELTCEWLRIMGYIDDRNIILATTTKRRNSAKIKAIVQEK